MPTILIKKSDTPGSVPGTANLTNLAGGAEVAVNTADRRMFTMNSSSAVVELGTNPSSLTCADGSFTLLKAASASITNLTATSLVLSNLSIASANVTTLTSASATITNLLATSLTVSGNTFLATSSGNVGIANTSPSSYDSDMRNLVVGTSGATGISIISGTSSNGTLAFGDGTGAATYRGYVQYNHTNDYLVFGTAAAERMRLDSSGNLGIGTSSPSSKLTVQGIIRTTDGTNYSLLDNNYLRSYASGTFYFDNATTGQSFVWRMSSSSALDTTALTLTSSGNLGLGVTPSAWSTLVPALQIGGGGSFIAAQGNSVDALYMGTNAHFDGTNWKYKISQQASYYLQNDGIHSWHTAASGTAGNTITFTQAMTLDSTGLAIGTTTTTNSRLSIDNTASLNEIVFRGTAYTNIFSETTNGMQIGISATTGTPALEFFTNNTERARITSGGYSKFSNDGTYVGSGSSYHEFRQTNNEITLILSATNASTTSSGQRIRITRAASNAFEAMLIETDGGGNNLYNLRGDGNAYADGTWNNNGADYAEYFESATGGALTVGATVVLEGNKVREATASDPVSAIMGVVRPKEPSKASMVVGNTAWNKWANKYLTDDFDRYIMEDHDVVEWTDEDGKQHSYESHNIPDGVTVPVDAVRKTHDDKGNKFQHYKLNPAWDKDAEYTPREKRPEWNIIGLVGQVKVLKGKPVNDRWIKMRDVSAAVEEWMIR